MIKKFLAREVEFLLEEFGAPNARTLLLRIAFWTYVTTGTGIVLGGLVAIYQYFGVGAFYVAVFVVVLICLRLQRGRPVYFGDGEIFRLGGGRPTLRPPGKPALLRRARLRSGGRVRRSPASIDPRCRKGIPNETPGAGRAASSRVYIAAQS
jgi:hypothetical protein